VNRRAVPAAESREVRRSEPLAWSSFDEAVRAGGCAVCRVVQDQQERALFSFLYEGMTNPDVSEKFLGGGGFCAEHFRAVMRLGTNRWSVGVVELGMLSERLLARASELLSPSGNRSRRKGLGRFAFHMRRRDDAPFPGRDCMFCRERGEWEGNAVGVLEDLVKDADLAAGIERNGLCLRHGQMGLQRWREPARRVWLAGLLDRTATRLRGELREFLRKYDYRFGQEPFGPEADVVPRAVEFLAGTEPRKWR
jgi:hypothetical protein